jgi:6-phosphogluconolactonase
MVAKHSNRFYKALKGKFMAETKIFADNPAVAAGFAKYFCDFINQCDQETVTVSLSGGSTPTLLFQELAANYGDAVDWTRVKFFWGDERCVGPEDEQSNYGQCKKLLLDKIAIPPENVFRVIGEDDPDAEAKRYGQTITEHVQSNDRGLPAFDLMILGMGGDGHTASIFPHQMELMTSENICEVAIHPQSGQKRVSVTGPVINASQRVVFLITGGGKADVLATVHDGSGVQYPATHVQPESKQIEFFLDQSAAAKL